MVERDEELFFEYELSALSPISKQTVVFIGASSYCRLIIRESESKSLMSSCLSFLGLLVDVFVLLLLMLKKEEKMDI